jgi:hypothetical protein
MGVFRDEGFRLYILPRSSTTTVDPDGNGKLFNEHDHTTSSSSSLLCHKGYLRIRLSSPRQPQSPLVSMFTVIWTPLVLDMETTPPALIKKLQRNGPNNNDKWTRLRVDWKAAALRYNWAHRWALVSSAAVTVLLLVSFLAAFSVFGTISPDNANIKLHAQTTTNTLFGALVVALMVWCGTMCRKHVSYWRLQCAVEQHGLDFVNENVYLEFRTVAEQSIANDAAAVDRQGRIDSHDQKGSLLGQSTGSATTTNDMGFIHYLYIFRVPENYPSWRSCRLVSTPDVATGRPMITSMEE